MKIVDIDETVDFDAFVSLVEGEKLYSKDWKADEKAVLDHLEVACIQRGLSFERTTGTASDFYGKYDCKINDCKIDVKAERSRDDTIQLSLGWTNSEGKKGIPGYFQKNVSVWVFDLNEGLDHFYGFTHKDLKAIQENPERFGRIYVKKGDRDYFHREHRMLVIPKENCRRVAF